MKPDYDESLGAVRVAALNPFWRYAVALAHRPDLPAIPYFTRCAAEVFAAESRAAFPDRRTIVYRRAGWRRIEEATDA